MTKVNVPDRLLSAPELLAAHRLLRGLPPEAALQMTAHAQLQQVRSAQILFHEGDAAHHYLLLASGQVEVLRYSQSGDERVFQVFETGQLVAEAAMFMPHGRYPMCARARSAAHIYRLQRDSLHQACRQWPQLAMNMLTGLSSTLYAQVNKVDWITSSSAGERLANYLLNLKERQGASIQLPLNQRQLAAYLGIRAETLSRLFTDWQARGYIAGKRSDWALCDEAYLRRLASPAQRSF
ncbi:Crp/Fnr family transcriptional regulator [Alcaligenes sp. SDU_A2]|uniref:Crp/Fnr family transcriptional regulator n=1 Tax=Alcaligenes sp. SDU_A2 TaxID=3136634 RepID=UPI002B8AF802|nr:Crp/Fnr family transcriptional regulator [Alcaligenes sp.]HRL26784.1 Crp/Fnr family transcriptional regulator [Alcaligenes sp.]